MKISEHTVVTFLLIVAVGVEALSVIEWATYPYFPDMGLFFARTDANIFDILAPFSPTLLILLLYTWPVRLAVTLGNRHSKRLRSFLNWIIRAVPKSIPQKTPNLRSRFDLTSRPRLLLLLSMALAVFLGLIPYRSDLNPSMTPIGVDAHFYIESVSQMLQRSPPGAVSYAMGNIWAGSRPLLLIPMYTAALTGLLSPNQTVQVLPPTIGPLLTVSTFLFVRKSSSNERMAGVASLFSTLSFNTTVGMWAGFYANWLALALAYLFLTTLFGFLGSPSMPKFVVMTLLSTSILLTHPWTWVVVLAVAAAFILTVWKDDRKTTFLWALVGLLTINIVIDFAKSLTFGGQVAALDASESLAGSGPSQTLQFWSNLISTLFTAYGGLMGNPILLGLPSITMLLLKFKDKFGRLLILWTALGSLPFLVLPSAIQTRILYDMPIPIMTSAAFFFLTRLLGNRPNFSNLTFLLLLLLIGNYTLRAVTSLVAAAL